MTFAPRTSDAPERIAPFAERLSVAAVTVWTRDGARVFSPERSDAVAGIGAMAAQGPLWLDLNLETDPQRWLQPWDPLRTDRTDWRGVAATAAAADLAVPAGDGESPEQRVLRHLPTVNEYAVLRWVALQAPPCDAGPLVMPLVGLIPAETLGPRGGLRTGGFEIVLVRVNLAVLGNCLVTIRLTDRLCTGSRGHGQALRLRAADFYDAPNLTVFSRFLPSLDSPSAADMADALAAYLAATCTTVAESARERLRGIERQLIDPSHHNGGGNAAVVGCHREMLGIRAALDPVDEELLRLRQRLSDPQRMHPAVERTCRRYDDARHQLESVEAEIRWASDAATNQLASIRLLEQREAEQVARDLQERSTERQKTLERVIAGLGTALVIAALVPSLFGESVKLPSPNRVGGFVGMVLIMLGTSGVVFWALVGLLNATSRSGRHDAPDGPGRRRWLTLAAAFNLAAALLMAAGVLVLLQFG